MNSTHALVARMEANKRKRLAHAQNCPSRWHYTISEREAMCICGVAALQRPWPPAWTKREPTLYHEGQRIGHVWYPTIREGDIYNGAYQSAVKAGADFISFNGQIRSMSRLT